MTGTVATERLLRIGAIAIAVAAAVDPVITSRRIGTPEISIVATNPHRDSALVARIAHSLGRAFVTTSAPLSSADATIIVGDQLPPDRTDLATPVLSVSPDADGSPVSIESIGAPAATSLDARAPVVATLHVRGAQGKTLVTSLSLDGVVTERIEHRVTKDDDRFTVPMTFVPTTLGAATLRVTASIAGASAEKIAAADLVIDATNKRWTVLFYDPRASWMSTFVRRAVESDDRFLVTSRVVTSRNISTDAGAPPASLDDYAATSRYDVVIVGAPNALSTHDVAGLDQLLRRRAASVVLFLDEQATICYT